MKPEIHAESSARRFGGVAADYLALHNLMDCSKSTIADARHRSLMHNAWFIKEILPKIFGQTITNSDGKKVSVAGLGEQHILEDFSGRFIPTVQDYLENMEYQEWMTAGHGPPPSSFRRIEKKHTQINKD